MKQQEPSLHKRLSSLRFLKHLHEEITLAEKLEDIQDKIILDKFKEIILILENELIPVKE